MRKTNTSLPIWLLNALSYDTIKWKTKYGTKPKIKTIVTKREKSKAFSYPVTFSTKIIDPEICDKYSAEYLSVSVTVYSYSIPAYNKHNEIEFSFGDVEYHVKIRNNHRVLKNAVIDKTWVKSIITKFDNKFLKILQTNEGIKYNVFFRNIWELNNNMKSIECNITNILFHIDNLLFPEASKKSRNFANFEKSVDFFYDMIKAMHTLKMKRSK